jgi:hypothetical protein
MPSESLFMKYILNKFKVEIPLFLPPFVSKDAIFTDCRTNQAIYLTKKLSV